MSDFFNHDKYVGIQPNVGSGEYSDPSDAYANGSQIFISFYSLIAGSKIGSINFKAFVTNFQDTFSSDWGSELVFGRNDPIYSFKGTTRNISLGFQVVAATLYEAIANLERVQLLSQCLYPGYTAPHRRSLNLTKPPLMKLKFANLISQHGGVAGANFHTLRGGSAEAKTGGLVGVIKSLNVTPNFEYGAFDGPGPATIYPKLIEITIDYGVIHQAELGFDSQTGARLPNSGRFYGASTAEAQGQSRSTSATEDLSTAVDNAPPIEDPAAPTSDAAPVEAPPTSPVEAAVQDEDTTQADIDEAEAIEVVEEAVLTSADSDEMSPEEYEEDIAASVAEWTEATGQAPSPEELQALREAISPGLVTGTVSTTIQ